MTILNGQIKKDTKHTQFPQSLLIWKNVSRTYTVIYSTIFISHLFNYIFILGDSTLGLLSQIQFHHELSANNLIPA